MFPCENNWKLGKCTCSYYTKNFMCKHLIAISATLRLVGCVIPLLAKSVPLGQKRKRGASVKEKMNSYYYQLIFYLFCLFVY